MERLEAVKQLKELADHDRDPEGTHVAADDVLVEFLRSEGYEDVAEAFEQCRDEVGFWYA